LHDPETIQPHWFRICGNLPRNAGLLGVSSPRSVEFPRSPPQLVIAVLSLRRMQGRSKASLRPGIIAMFKFCAAAIAAVAFASAAQATVVSADVDIAGGGTWVDYAGTGPIGNNSFDTDGTFYTMEEAQNVVLGAPVEVEGGLVDAGRAVDSHFLWFDPLGTQRIEATITFTGRILGVIITRSGLLATNDLLGLASVTYLTPRLVGLEAGDSFSFVDNVLTINWRTSTPGDHIRVLTAAVPAPATGGLLALALAGLALYRRRRAA
jgi:hypothetical protein